MGVSGSQSHVPGLKPFGYQPLPGWWGALAGGEPVPKWVHSEGRTSSLGPCPWEAGLQKLVCSPSISRPALLAERMEAHPACSLKLLGLGGIQEPHSFISSFIIFRPSENMVGGSAFSQHPQNLWLSSCSIIPPVQHALGQPLPPS